MSFKISFLSLDLKENIKEEENCFISPHPSLSAIAPALLYLPTSV